MRWSAEILEEMQRNLVAKGITTKEKAARLREVMEDVFPEAAVTGHAPPVAAVENEEGDRHVVAAALKAGAQVITTANLKHFRRLPDGIEAQGPDEFLCNLFDLDPAAFVEMLREQAADLQKPPTSFDELLERLARVAPGLVTLVREHVAEHGA